MFDELINNFILIKRKEEITKDDAIIENCGDYASALNGYFIVIPLSCYDDLLTALRNNSTEVYEQVLKLKKEVSVVKLIAETFIKAKEVRITSHLVDTYKGNVNAILNAYSVSSYNTDNIMQDYNEPQNDYNQNYMEQQPAYNNVYNQNENNTEDDVFSRDDLLEIINVIGDQYPMQADLVRKTALRMYDSGNVEGASELALTVVNEIIGGNDNVW